MVLVSSQGEVFATAFTSPLFMGKFPFGMTTSSNVSSTSGNAGTERKVYPLSRVTDAVSAMLKEQAGSKLFWVRAEISQCGFKNGHAYLDLVEEHDGKRKAQLRGTIWSGQLSIIRKSLGKEFDEVLKAGREIVFSAHMSFHAVWGFSLNIQHIDLDVLLGEMERRRKATLEALRKEGAIGRNGRLALASVPQRLILIGSAGTAGFTDFMAHLQKNDWGYAMDVGVIDVPVQGAHAPEALIGALHLAGRVAMRTSVDAVVMLRGGGAKLDLDVFNDLSLCRTMAAMDVPVLVGVGHETDQTLVDVVAHTACKTPTAVADFVIDRMAEFEAVVGREGRSIAAEAKSELSENRGFIAQSVTFIRERPLSLVRGQRGALHTGANAVVRRTRMLLSERQHEMGRIRTGLSTAAAAIPMTRKMALDDLQERLSREAQRQLRQQEERMGNLKGTLALLGPEPTLKRGFSITRKGGQAVRSASQLESGDVIVTQLADGEVRSIVDGHAMNEDH